MRIFAYEMVTAGGLPTIADEPTRTVPNVSSLLAEGRAMIEALATDLSACRDVMVDLLWPAELAPPVIAGVRFHPVDHPSDEQASFDRLAQSADGTIVIAPETAGLLAQRCRRVIACGGHHLGPNLELVELVSDKASTAAHLAAAGVRVPQGQCISAGDRLPADFDYPAVLKPRDGAGSQDTFLLADAVEATYFGRAICASRLERFCAGRAASVALLCGHGQHMLLPACWQHLSDDGRFTYLGGRTIGEPELRARAWRLAERVVHALPSPRGYLGIDLVLGDDPSGRQDCVIEVNPRLTTSYVGLRHAVVGNLAQAWLDLLGGQVPALSFTTHPVEFDADGRVRCGSGI